ncbi:MAG TPA: polymer-forming cytoskeletal protein [Longimicrobiaceae bacterium]
MWKKDDTPTAPPAPQPERSTSSTPTASNSPAATSAAPAPTAAPRSSNAERAAIGRSISIRGDVTGDEDLLIQGRVEGSINLQNCAVTIGSEGEVKASVTGRVVVVEGSVEGNISSEEQVVLRSSARVQGDITAPRVVLEDGARFRGGIDMGDLPEFTNGKAASKNEASTKAPAATAATSGTSGNDKSNSDSAKGEKPAAEGDAKKKGSPELFAEARA